VNVMFRKIRIQRKPSDGESESSEHEENKESDYHLTKKIAFRVTTNHSIDYPAHRSSRLWFPSG
jgi:hypothetical protein